MTSKAVLDRKKAWYHQYYAEPENRERLRVTQRRYYAVSGVKQRNRENTKKFRAARIKYMWSVYRRTCAAGRGHSFDLTRDKFDELVQMPCHYCYGPPDPTNGLDRVDNDLGYTESNVVPCCKICNRAKRDMPIEDFVAWLGRVADAHKK